jgi:Rieske Fe-S protein
MKISLEPIKPKKNLLDPARYEAELAKATRDSVEGVKADFKKTTATWQHQPVWYITRRGTDWYIGTKDEIYGYVDEGTKPHDIPAKPGKFLRFYRTGFKPKSRVGYIASYAGAKATKDLTFTKIVHHPGTKARQFSVKIREKWAKKFAQACRQAIKNASS